MRSYRTHAALCLIAAAALSVLFSLHALAARRPTQDADQAPIAENMSISTYKNVPVSGSFQAVDAEGAPLVYQIVSDPARGYVTVAEDGSGTFLYTPYENKVGKDSFTYVAVDPVGNLSNPARVSVRIEKQKSGVIYSDMGSSGAHKSAVRLAEAGIFVGERVGDAYFFHPDAPVSRGQFLAMAMTAAGLEPLTPVSMTGFADDAAIPAWAKGHVSSALRAGAVSGMRDENGRAVFRSEDPVTRAQAAAMLQRLLGVSDVAVESWGALGIGADEESHWAMRAAVNLSTAGIMRSRDSDPLTLDEALTREEAARLLDRSLDVLARREQDGWFLW